MKTIKYYTEFVNENLILEATSPYYNHVIETFTNIVNNKDYNNNGEYAEFKYYALAWKTSRNGTSYKKGLKVLAAKKAKKVFGGKPAQCEELVECFGTTEFHDLSVLFFVKKEIPASELVEYIKKKLKKSL